MAKKYLWIFMAWMISSWSFAQESELTTFSLEEAILYAIDHQDNLKNAALDVESANYRVKEIRGTGLPQVSASANLQHFLTLPTTLLPEEFGLNPVTGEVDPNFDPEAQFGAKNNITGELQASQLLFSGPYLLGLKAADIYVDIARIELDRQKIDIHHNVRQAYLAVLVAEENIRLLEKNKKPLERILFETEQLYENGFTEALEVARLKLSSQNLDTRIENAQRQVELAYYLLKFQMAYPLEETIELTETLENYITEDIENIEAEVSLPNRVEFHLLAKQAEFNEIEYRATKAGYLPTLSAFASFQRSFQADNLKVFAGPWFPTRLIGLQLNIPIFDGFQRSAQLQQKKVEGLKIRNNALSLEKALNFEVSQAKTNCLNALDKVKSQKDNIALAEKIYQQSLIKYKEGLGSSFELISAESALLESQSFYVNALYELIVAQQDLNKALGKLEN